MNAGVRIRRVSRNFVLASAAVAALMLGAAASASAGTLDQQQTDGSANPGGIGATQSLAQTFTAGLSGALDQVDLDLSKTGAPTDPLFVEIRGVSGGVPGATVLAGQSVPPSSVSPVETFVAISFASPAAVVAGTQYAIVVSSSAAGGNGYGWRNGSGDTYAAGIPCFTGGPPSGTWTCISTDFAFKTYVVPTPPGLSPVNPTATTITCEGQPATLVGTEGNDVDSGTPGRDVIAGLGGNDTLSGLAGNDLICGGAGKDKLKGGAGSDKLFGEAGKDTLKGGGAKDVCIGGKGNDSGTCEVGKL
jgi:Ca2+-binding RTX toxin-like protein